MQMQQKPEIEMLNFQLWKNSRKNAEDDWKKSERMAVEKDQIGQLKARVAVLDRVLS